MCSHGVSTKGVFFLLILISVFRPEFLGVPLGLQDLVTSQRLVKGRAHTSGTS